jgi:hypothetical protein
LDRERVDTESDFVSLPRYGNSLEAAVRSNPDGLPDRIIAKALLVESEEAVSSHYEEIVKKLRQALRVV